MLRASLSDTVTAPPASRQQPSQSQLQSQSQSQSQRPPPASAAEAKQQFLEALQSDDFDFNEIEGTRHDLRMVTRRC